MKLILWVLLTGGFGALWTAAVQTFDALWWVAAIFTAVAITLLIIERK